MKGSGPGRFQLYSTLVLVLITSYQVNACGRPVGHLDKDGNFLEPGQVKNPGWGQRLPARPLYNVKPKAGDVTFVGLPPRRPAQLKTYRQQAIKLHYPAGAPLRRFARQGSTITYRLKRMKRRPIHPTVVEVKHHPGGEVLCN